MKTLRLVLFILIAGVIPSFAQKPIAPREWTPWAPNLNKWAEFLIITSFRGGNKTPEQLAKKDLKSLKIDCQIFGRLSKNLPYELRGIETVRILYSEYGKFETWEDFKVDYIELLYSGDGQYINPVTITRPAAEFDVAEARQPISEIEMTRFFSGRTISSPVTFTLKGHPYFVGAHWRRKGKTVEVKIDEYRPTPQISPNP